MAAPLEALSGQDAGFLDLETRNLPMHVGGAALFDIPDALRGPDGALDAAALSEQVIARLGRVPRLNQCVIRAGGRRVWSRAEGWSPTENVRCVRLPAPGGSLALDALASDFLSRPLDRKRPLWQLRIVTGIDGDKQFALLAKMHHAMVDGAAGVALLQALFTDASPEPAPPAPVASARARSRAREALRGLIAFLGRAWPPVPRGPLTGPALPKRHIRTLELDLAPFDALRGRAGATWNDLLLALVSAAAERWLGACGHRVAAGRPRIRAFCPVDLRRDGERKKLGNRLGALLVELPQESDPARALEALVSRTRRAKASGESGGMALLGRLSAWLPGWLPRLIMTLAGRLRLYNLVVSHVRMPDVPMALEQAPLIRVAGYAPLFARQRLSVTAFRRGRRMRVGLLSSAPGAQDVERFAQTFEQTARELAAASRPGLADEASA